MHDVRDARRFTLTGDVHLVLLDPAGRILMGRRQNTGFADGAYHVPAGHLEAGESVVQALIREAREEIGISVAPEAAEFSHVMHNSSSGGRIACFFSVRQWDGTPTNCEPDKCGELRWFPLDDLPTNMIGYCRTALQHISAGEPFSTYGW